VTVNWPVALEPLPLWLTVNRLTALPDRTVI